MKNLKLDLALYLCIIVVNISLNQSIAILTFMLAIYVKLGVLLDVIINKKRVVI